MVCFISAGCSRFSLADKAEKRFSPGYFSEKGRRKGFLRGIFLKKGGEKVFSTYTENRNGPILGWMMGIVRSGIEWLNSPAAATAGEIPCYRDAWYTARPRISSDSVGWTTVLQAQPLCHASPSDHCSEPHRMKGNFPAPVSMDDRSTETSSARPYQLNPMASLSLSWGRQRSTHAKWFGDVSGTSVR
jgi:hypothetical protein